MTDYKAIHGKTVQSLATDPDSAAYEGQIWFNTTGSDYKTIQKTAGAWSTGGNISANKAELGSCGTQTAGMIFGGIKPGVIDETEQYNGSTWSEVGDLNTARSGMGGAGTQTAGS